MYLPRSNESRYVNKGIAFKQKLSFNNYFGWEVVVAQLAERLLPIPEDPGSNPVIGNF